MEGCANCKQLQRVKVMLENTEQTSRELRTSLGALRKELVDRDRQIDVSKKMRDHLAQDKAQLEIKAEHDKATIRRLEQRLAAAEAGEGLQAKVAKYRAQLLELKELHNDTEARLMLSEEARINAAREVHVLKSALGLRPEVADGALDSHGKLLHALAQSQEESSSLALALASKESALAEGAAALRAAQQEVERLLSVRLHLVRDAEEARGEAGEALHLAGVYRREVTAARSEVGALQEQLQQYLDAQARTEAMLRTSEVALATQQDRNRLLQERLVALERAGRLSAEALESEVGAALEAADVKVTEARAEATARAAALGEQLGALQRQLEASLAARTAEAARQQEQVAAVEAAAARARVERDGLEVQLAECRREVARTREELQESEHARHDLLGELQRVQSEAERASREAAATARQLTEERAEVGALRSRLEAVDAQLRSKLAAGSAREEALQDQVDQLRREVATSQLVVSRLQEDLAASKQHAAGASAQRAASDNQVEELHATLQSVATSKAKLQQGMMEQLGVFREKLALVEDENRQLRLALGLVGSSNSKAIGASGGHREGGAHAGAPARPPPHPARSVDLDVDSFAERLANVPSTKALEQAVSAASAAAAMARINAASAARSPGGKGAPRYVGAMAAGSLPRSLASTPSSLLTRARMTSRALGCEDSEDEGDDTDDDLDQRASRRRMARMRIAAVGGGAGGAGLLSSAAKVSSLLSSAGKASAAVPGGRAAARVPPEGSLLSAQALANMQSALRQRAGYRGLPLDG